ncbi:hypothetical protein L596_005508 [Steinernema carpocapsae]|uniref:Fibronectin type-III domain-containing protein n=1 Tax=Steinernema carpocapsae TaxID=34508 RepID=A0A4U8UZ82_STECR|nr:hypothetical protein L596_005508 [Steinernema carpocapsae]
MWMCTFREVDLLVRGKPNTETCPRSTRRIRRRMRPTESDASLEKPLGIRRPCDPLRRPNGDRVCPRRVASHRQGDRNRKGELPGRQADITLSPWVNYTFRVIAYNSHGASQPGYKLDAVCSTKPSANPEDVRALGTDPTNLVIYWTPMDKIDWNAPQLNYLVRYRLNREGENWHEFLVEDPQENHTIIRDQPTFSEYEIQVRAVNSEGVSIIPPDTTIGYSGEDLPTDAPQNFRLEAYHNFSSALLNWDAVNRSSLRGHFEGYRVDYWLTQEPYNVETLYTDHNVTSIILSRLGAVTNYSARVYAMNTKHSSPPSEELQFFTPEGAPSKVHNLRVRAVGSTSLLLTWAPPLQPNGQIRGFFVSFENATGDIEETYVLHRQLYYLYEEATPDSAYKVSEGQKRTAARDRR